MFQSLDLVTSLFIDIISTSSWWSLVQGHGHMSRKGCQSVCPFRALTIERIDLETLCWLDRHIKVMWPTSRSCDQWSCDQYWGHVINVKVMWSTSRLCDQWSCDQHWGHVINVKVMWPMVMIHVKLMWSILRSCDQYWGHVINIKVTQVQLSTQSFTSGDTLQSQTVCQLWPNHTLKLHWTTG